MSFENLMRQDIWMEGGNSGLFLLLLLLLLLSLLYIYILNSNEILIPNVKFI